MADEDAKYLKNKGKEFFDAKNFEEAINCYEKAALLNPDEAATFKGWGDSLARLAEIKKDDALYREAFAKYEQAAQIKPDDAVVINNWGYTLVGLAKIKGDETLYLGASAKFEQAVRIDSNYAVALSNWGTAFGGLAKMKKDEKLFREAIAKYEQAVQIDPNLVVTFISWGGTLAGLAGIKKDEALYQEAFAKFKQAARIDPNFAAIFSNWGYALAGFAEITDDEDLIKTLFEEFYQKSNKLKKLKKSILEVCIIFSNKSMKEIINIEKYFPLLESDLNNDDSIFFEETTNGITDPEKLDKYKKAYILSVIIISQLHINNKNEKSVAYYTNKTASQEMLFNNNAFRLNAINYSNDPTEGKVLLDYLFGEGKYLSKEFNTGYGAFAGCFTFNHDSLNQFRLYGKTGEKEGTGLSLVFKDTFFSKEARMAVKQENISVEEDKQQALFRCIYIDPVTQRVETVGHKEKYLFFREKNEQEMDQYYGYIDEILKSVEKEMAILKKIVEEEQLEPEIIGQLLINLRYLTKHIAFKEEQECRIIKIHPLNDKETVKINPPLGNDGNIEIKKIKQLYIDYQKIIGHVEKIYFGPNAGQMELFQDFLRYKDQNISCERSKNPLSK